MYGDAQPFCVGQFHNASVGLLRLWIGAPAAVMTLEETIACASKTILEVGMAGGLQPYLKPGDIVIVTQAIRDEGTSHHYPPPEVKVESTPKLRDMLVENSKRRRSSIT